MTNEILYMLGIVAAGFAVNYTLRALPFILFAGRDRELPHWVTTFGQILSPIIIAGLIIYSYSGLEWRTAYPYLAGALTILLQLWKRNPLASIVLGTVLYMALVNCGCASKPTVIELDAEHPTLSVSSTGVTLAGRPVKLAEVAEELEDCDIPHDQVIYIHLDPQLKDLRLPRVLMAVLAKSGYTRSVLVTKRHAESAATGRKAKTAAPAAAPKKKSIRYKKANE